jgi:hypothetical protein
LRIGYFWNFPSNIFELKLQKAKVRIKKDYPCIEEDLMGDGGEGHFHCRLCGKVS